MAKDFRSGVIETMRSWVGITEQPPNSNRIFVWNETKPEWQGYPYCGATTTLAYLLNGVDLRKVPGLNPYYCPSIEAWAKRIGAWKTDGGKSGDMVLYGFGHNEAVHIGISNPDPNASGYRAIEGNTSPGSAGSQSNGGGIYERYRGRGSIRGWVDADKVAAYVGGGAVARAATEATVAANRASGLLDTDGIAGRRTVSEVQARLRSFDSTLEVDGRMGPHTVRVLQAALGTPVDGKISDQRSGVKYWPGLSRSVLERGNTGNGSTMVKALQRAVGANPDGWLGSETATKFQAKLNADKRFLVRG